MIWHVFSVAICIESIAQLGSPKLNICDKKIVIFGTPRNCNPPRTAQRLPSTFSAFQPQKVLVGGWVSGRGAEKERETELVGGAWRLRYLFSPGEPKTGAARGLPSGPLAL